LKSIGKIGACGLEECSCHRCLTAAAAVFFLLMRAGTTLSNSCGDPTPRQVTAIDARQCLLTLRMLTFYKIIQREMQP
jgi:hypothetical protein